MSFETTRRIRLVSLYAVLAGGASLPYIFIFFQQYPWLGIVTLIFSLICAASLFLNRNGFFTLASHFLFISSNLYLFTTASAFGRSTGEQLLFLPVMFGTVLIFDFTAVRSMVFTIVFSLTCLVVLELTNYELLNVYLSPDEQLSYYYGNIFLTFGLSVVIAVFYFNIYAKQNIRNESILQEKVENEKTVNYFATSLYGKNTVDEILWDIAKNCISQLGFTDCVIYTVDYKRNILVQKAAFGPKNPNGLEIKDSIEIMLGKGIVGSVAISGQAEIIPDTTLDPRYIVDDESRLSEIAVPILLQGKVFGVIDSEHATKNFFTADHLNILTTIAAFCGNKITKAIADEENLKSTIDKLESDKIRDLDKLKSKFFSNISHEFRTPLTMILGPLDDLVRTTKNPEELKQFKMMHANGRKLLRLINDLMELAKLDQGVLEFNSTQEDIHRFIRTVVASFHSQAMQNKIKFESTISEDAYIMAFDMSKVETIVINLLTSVLKFTPAGGAVTTSTSTTSEHFKFIVSNDGSQIPADQHDKIFERFYQTDHADFYDGYGIGLALAKELTAMHGGEITIESSAKGNIFTVSLPIKTFNQLSTKEKTKESPKYIVATESEKVSKKPVVLLVEDNTDLRKYLRKVLDEDFTLYEAANGAEGVNLATQHLPDLIISDVMMPIKDGFELCFEIKSTEVTSHIPVLLLTAKADMESKLEGLKTGADYYLAKPFEPRELLTASTNLIAQRKKLRENFSKKLLLQPKEWEGASADERFLQKLMEFVEEKIAEPDFSVEDMQQEMGISRMQLHRKLKALTDQSATEFIRTIRLKRAAEMLQKDFDNVSQVAYQVGFSSLSYFTKCFKEQYGVLPSEFSTKNSTIS